MTLTRLIPSLRTSVPDPLNIDLWPESTAATTTDVVVCGLSLLRLVDVCGTPCVHSGSSVIPGSLGRPSQTHKTAVLVVRITAVTTHSSGRTIIQTDAHLRSLRLVWSELRLINRASTAHTSTMLVAGSDDDVDLAHSEDVFSVELPRDLRVGDLLAVPSRPLATTWALRPHPLTGTFDSSVGASDTGESPTTAAASDWLSHLS